jgi:hypothetical protein
VCKKRNKPQATAIVLNELDRELYDDIVDVLPLIDCHEGTWDNCLGFGVS